MKLNVKALALACGIFWGLALFFVTWWIIMFEGCSGDSTFIAYVYRGYSLSPIGSLIGLVWGFIDGLIGGAIFGWLYNWLCGRGGKTA
jgi:hypothetical protein